MGGSLVSILIDMVVCVDCCSQKGESIL
jgi:hypothetical protein